MKTITNISIPDFVLKNKRVLKSKISNQYINKKDSKTNKQLYNNIIQKIPTYSKNLVIIGYTKNASNILDIVSTNFNLKEVFKNSKKNIQDQEFNRFEWLNYLMEINKYNKIKFFIAK